MTTPAGERLGHSTPTKRAGHATPPRRIDVDLARRLHFEEGLTVTQVALRLGFSYIGVYAALRKVGPVRKEREGWTTSPEGCRLNQIWSQLRRRCAKQQVGAGPLRPDSTMRVCREWARFEPFLDFALEANWRPGLALVRIDRTKSYSPENCRFVSREEASRGKRLPIGGPKPVVLVTAFGETKSLSGWIDDSRCRVTITGLSLRLKRGWKPEDAISREPMRVGYNGEYKRYLVAFGEKKSLSSWCRDPRCKVTKPALIHRLKHGASVEDALSSPSFRWRASPAEHV